MNDENIYFDLEQVRALIPQLKQMLILANDELDEFAIRLSSAKEQYEETARQITTVHTHTADTSSTLQLRQLRQSRQNFQNAIEELSMAKQSFLDCLDVWVERITETGVILRDIRSGLLDFPARNGNFEYLLCWKLGERDVQYWHPVGEGFIDRKPLAVLAEYF